MPIGRFIYSGKLTAFILQHNRSSFPNVNVNTHSFTKFMRGENKADFSCTGTGTLERENSSVIHFTVILTGQKYISTSNAQELENDFGIMYINMSNTRVWVHALFDKTQRSMAYQSTVLATNHALVQQSQRPMTYAIGF